MPDLTGSSALAGRLSATSDELRALAARVEGEAAARPHLDTSAWVGPASWGCQFSLAMLARELDAAVALVRCAADLAGAAAWEARTGG